METFVVRLWRPATISAQSDPANEEAGHDVLRGVIEHPVTGNSRPFDSGADLVETITRWRDVATVEPSDRGR